MAAIATIYNAPRGYDQTQKQFQIYGTIAITGTYTITTGIVPNFATGILTASGGSFILPPTYTGPNGPGQGVPTIVWVQSVGGYNIIYLGGTLRIYNGTTELTTGTVPGAISAAGIQFEASFLRG